MSDDRERIFWLSGMAGTGKSAIAKSACTRICSILDDSDFNEPVSLFSFFISRHTADRRTPLRILHTLVYFLARVLPSDFRRHVLDALSDRPELLSLSIADQMRYLIGEPLERCDTSEGTRLVIVIDAFDECDKVQGQEGGEFLPSLLSMIKSSNVHVRLLITSRNEHTIGRMFAQCREDRTIRLHDIDKQTVARDIKAYFAHEFPSLETSSLDSLTDKAHGLFIYAATVVRFVKLNEFFEPDDLLRRILQPSTIESSFERPPDPDYDLLDEMYMHILRSALPPSTNRQNIDSAASVVRTIVTTLVLLQDELPISSLARIVGLKQDQVTKVIQRLYSVIEIDAAGVARFLHISFSEFLLDPARCRDPSFRVDGVGAGVVTDYHGRIATGCIAFLNSTLHEGMAHVLRPPPPAFWDVPATESVDSNAVLLRYACQHWCTHLSSSTPLPALPNPLSHHLGTALHQFCLEHIFHWIEAISLLRYVYRIRDALTSAAFWCEVSHTSTSSHVQHADLPS